MTTKHKKTVFSTHAQGKLLLTGEYAVLDGAKALALPTRLGQTLDIVETEGKGALHWESYTHLDELWFEAVFNIQDFSIKTSSDRPTAEVLQKMLHTCRTLNPNFLENDKALQATTRLEFPRDWGLGSSSTLVAALAKWAEVSPYPILENPLGGSGYDLACAYAESPIIYNKNKETAPTIEAVEYKPPFSEQLYFVHLGKKQNSREGIRSYRENTSEVQELSAQINYLTHEIGRTKTLQVFCMLLNIHEKLIGQAIGQTPVQEVLFPDFKGQMKSLGAWGGDFVLAASAEPSDYVLRFFKEKGHGTVLRYEKMVLF